MAPVGVSGLILGGGISHFASKRGWACDNVASFELVTASGTAINVSATSYPDLYWALRGGGNNFGIVTNFKLDAFALGQMWGGQRVYLEDAYPAVLDAIHQFTVSGSVKDEDAAQIVVSALISLPTRGRLMCPDFRQRTWNRQGRFRQPSLCKTYRERACILRLEQYYRHRRHDWPSPNVWHG